MPWSQRFIDELGSGRTDPIFLLESFAPTVGRSIKDGDAMKISSSPVPGYLPVISMDGQGGPMVSVTGPSVEPRTWSTSFGGFEVGVADDLRRVRNRLAKGTPVRLRMGFAGWDVGAYQDIALGVVSNIRQSAGRWTIECKDLLAALRSRLTFSSLQTALFNDLPLETTVRTSYGGTGTTLNVDDESGNRGTGLNGALYVTPTTGDPFWLAWTGVTGGPGFSVQNADKWGTTRVAADVGDRVQVGYRLQGSPFLCVSRVLHSTGAGTNGADDDLPITWGYGLRKEYFDHGDGSTFDERGGPATGNWEPIGLDRVADGFTFLSGFLARTGGFLMMHQGRLTVRTALNPLGRLTRPKLHITDDDIALVESYEQYASEYAIHYQRYKVTDTSATTTTTTGQVSSLPCEDDYEVELLELFNNESGWRSHLASRLRPFMIRVPEKVVLTLAPLSWAQLTPGDTLRLSTTKVTGRRDRHKDGFSEAPVWVSRVDPSYVGGSVRVTCYIYPPDED